MFFCIVQIKKIKGFKHYTFVRSKKCLWDIYMFNRFGVNYQHPSSNWLTSCCIIVSSDNNYLFCFVLLMWHDKQKCKSYCYNGKGFFINTASISEWTSEVSAKRSESQKKVSKETCGWQSRAGEGYRRGIGEKGWVFLILCAHAPRAFLSRSM